VITIAGVLIGKIDNYNFQRHCDIVCLQKWAGWPVLNIVEISVLSSGHILFIHEIRLSMQYFFSDTIVFDPF
jgi:hypothetical protein